MSSPEDKQTTKCPSYLQGCWISKFRDAALIHYFTEGKSKSGIRQGQSVGRICSRPGKSTANGRNHGYWRNRIRSSAYLFPVAFPRICRFWFPLCIFKQQLYCAPQNCYKDFMKIWFSEKTNCEIGIPGNWSIRETPIPSIFH